MPSCTPSTDLFQLFTAPLNTLGLRYLVSGSVASILYGEPRVTHDIDIVLALTVNDVPGLIASFPIDEFYCPPSEVLRIEVRRRMRGHFNLIHHETGFKADIYLLDEGPLHRWAISQRQCVDLAGGKLWVASPEYVILSKLEYYREGGSEKHLRDIRGILQVSGVDVDRGEIERWVARLGLDAQWLDVNQRTMGDSDT